MIKILWCLFTSSCLKRSNNRSQTQIKSRGQADDRGRIQPAFEVSRITVRKAIELLADDGFVVRKQGIGTFVAERNCTVL